jgi:heparan-alpha-glucosaminide N-acetyltransferase
METVTTSEPKSSTRVEKGNRILSIDVMRGFTLVLMLFVNDLYMPGVPAWLGHVTADVDGMGLADWVFPGFMFMVGMSIPYSIGNRISRGQDRTDVLKHILVRTASLLIIGVLMANSRDVNAEYTGMTKSLWSLITYTGVFLIWNNYDKSRWNRKTIYGLQVLGLLMIIPMVYIFRSADDGGFRFNSWGILGTIGWGFLVAALVYRTFRDDIRETLLFVAGFLVLNMLSNLNMLDFLSAVKPVLGRLINGNAPFIVLSGMLVALILRKGAQANAARTLLIIVTLGIVSIAAGFLIRPWFIISKIQATPSWALICNGISMVLFALLFWIVDIMKKVKWSLLLRPAGANSLTVYLVPDMFYYIIWQFSLPFLFYKHLPYPGLVILGSIAWALIMGVALPILLQKIDFRLKL